MGSDDCSLEWLMEWSVSSNLIITMFVYTCVVVHIYHCQFSLTDFVIIIIFLFIIIHIFHSECTVDETIMEWYNGEPIEQIHALDSTECDLA